MIFAKKGFNIGVNTLQELLVFDKIFLNRYFLLEDFDTELIDTIAVASIWLSPEGPVLMDKSDNIVIMLIELQRLGYHIPELVYENPYQGISLEAAKTQWNLKRTVDLFTVDEILNINIILKEVDHQGQIKVIK